MFVGLYIYINHYNPQEYYSYLYYKPKLIQPLKEGVSERELDCGRHPVPTW